MALMGKILPVETYKYSPLTLIEPETTMLTLETRAVDR